MEYQEIYNEIARKEKQNKLEKYRILNQYARKNGILLVGSSLMEDFPIGELLLDFGENITVYNRAISGYTSEELLAAVDVCILALLPRKLFINIGSNDIAQPEYRVESLLHNYEKILTQIKDNLPETEVYVMAYYPVNEVDDFQGRSEKSWFCQRNNKNIAIANESIKEMAERMGYQYINLNQGLKDEKGQLKKAYTIEGIHMYANGYKQVLETMLLYIR